MPVGLIRFMDYWLGIPLCFLLTRLDSLIRPFSRPASACPRKFLFIELSEMGSAVLAYPAIRHLRDIYPNAEFYFAIFEKNRASVDILGMIKPENVLAIRERSLMSFIRSLIKCVLRMRRERIDVTFDLELFARATAAMTYLSGAPTRVGFYKYTMEGLYRGNLLTHKVQYNFQQHISKSFLSFVKILEYPHKTCPAMDWRIADDEIKRPVYSSSSEAQRNIWRKLKDADPSITETDRLILLNPSGGEIPIRAWPLDHYIALASKLSRVPAFRIVLIGTSKDKHINEQVRRARGNERCVNFAGSTSFPELMDLFCAAGLLITNDSGPAQFAAMTDIKNMVFFGPETPRIYSPLGRNTRIIYADFSCSPCLSAFNHRDTVCMDNKCLRSISVEEVYRTVLQEMPPSPD